MENIFFLILVAVVGLVRWLSQVAENKKNAEAAKRTGPAGQSSSPLAPRGAPQTEEERVRKFFEALGVPTSSDPPPRVQPRQVTPAPSPKRTILPVDPFPKPRGRVLEPRPPVPVAPPPVTATPPPLPEALPLPARETTARAGAREFRREASRPVEFEVRDLDEAIAEDSFSHAGLRTDGGKAQATTGSGFAARLGTVQGLRDAVVLREIFGPPRSMQTIERL